jgi:hypothetical protein
VGTLAVGVRLAVEVVDIVGEAEAVTPGMGEGETE